MDLYEGDLWRYIPGHAVSAWDLRYLLHNEQRDGRWHRTGQSSCFYATFDLTGCLLEFTKLLRTNPGLPPSAYDVVQLKMVVRDILDLVDPEVRNRYGLGLEQMTGDDQRHLEACRRVADRARSEGYHAIRSVSAADPGRNAINLNVFGDTKAPGWMALEDVARRESMVSYLDRIRD